MAMSEQKKLRVFVDADVLFAGSASQSQHGASLIVLRMSEITLIDAISSEQVITEVERNLTGKIPQALPTFRLLANRSLTIVPSPSSKELQSYKGLADDKDLPILVAALKAECRWLVTFNLRHFQPGHKDIIILQPGDFIRQVRGRLSQLR